MTAITGNFVGARNAKAGIKASLVLGCTLR